MVKEHDVRLVIHNHGPEDKRCPAPEDAYNAVKTRDKRMGLCIDIGHTSAPAPIRCRRSSIEDRLYDMHVKDLNAKTDKESQVEVGRGVLDFPGSSGRC